MSKIRVLVLLSAAAAAGCGLLPSSAPVAPRAAATPGVTAAPPAAPSIVPTASSSVFRHDAAVPDFEGYISGY